MTTLDPGGPHVDGRDMLIAELEDRLTAAQAENRRLRPVVDKAKAWRARILSDGEYATEDADDLAAAVDALGTDAADAADGAGTGEHWAAGHVEVLAQVAIERKRQDAKWGEQNHADGTGMAWPELVIPAFGWASGGNQAEQAANLVRKACQRAAKTGHTTWLHILLEEIAETFAETDPAALRVELIHTAAVAVAWVEAIDRRAAASPAGSSTADEGVAR